MRRQLRKLEQARKKLMTRWRKRFRGLFERLHDLLGKGDDKGLLAAIEKQLERAFRLGFWQNFAAAADVQAKILNVVKIADNIIQRGVESAKKWQQIASGRAIQVLAKANVSVDAYTNIVVSKMSMTAIKEGFRLVGIGEGATHKQFVRIARAGKPRGHHTSLEGSVIRVSEKWNIGGYLVDAPHDDRLPLEETIHCHHAAVYLRKKSRFG